MRRIFVLASVACVSLAHGQNVVVPSQFANTSSGGGGLNTFIRDINAPRTGQLLINANQLGALTVGDQITGITFRLFAGAGSPFPATDATWSDYSIWVGPGVAPSAGSTTFASNFAGAATQVRSGALTIPANSFSSTGSPKPFGFNILFQTPYTYTGGHLTIEIRHTGSNITNNSANDFLEAVATTDAGYAAGNYRSYTTTTYAGTTGALASFTVAQLSYAPVPEPATLAVLGLGALAVARRRKSRRA
jgi:hypothetical protein